ncbi:hypothetical protein BGZ50_007812 [Haplosporangium sp. Z 11]|nr:hypothetical protein BGZ50_007812 [Haplosporangium sp. Z 11]
MYSLSSVYQPIHIWVTAREAPTLRRSDAIVFRLAGTRTFRYTHKRRGRNSDQVPMSPSLASFWNQRMRQNTDCFGITVESMEDLLQCWRKESRLERHAHYHSRSVRPPERLFIEQQGTCGRFHPIVSIIEDMIAENDPTTWRERVDAFMYRLTTADIPTSAVERKLFHSNLCVELQHVLGQVEAGPTTFTRFQGIRATLKFAAIAFIMQDGFLSYKWEPLELVEVAFGGVRGYKDDRYTMIDEPFVFRTADVFFRKTDPRYFQHQRDLLATCFDGAVRGKYWETVLPTNLEKIFHGKVMSKDLFNGAKPPYEMFLRKAEFVGQASVIQTTRHEIMTLGQFLDAHFYHNSEHNGDPIPPFFFLEVRASDIKCPVFVQLKLCTELWRSSTEKTRGTVQPTKINNHGIDVSQYCKPHKHYISLIVSYPTEVIKYFKNESLAINYDEDIIEMILTIDDENIRKLFAEEYVTVLEQFKRLRDEMSEGLERAKRARI